MYSLYGVKLSKYIDNFPKGLREYTNEELVFRFGKNSKHCYAKNVIILIVKKKKRKKNNKVKNITRTKNIIHRTLL